jgi:hypothetical protein
MGIIQSILLERSVVFFTNSKFKLTSSVIFTRLLLHPFKWWHLFMPTIPLTLLEVIEAPIPILCGMYFELTEHVSWA